MADDSTKPPLPPNASGNFSIDQKGGTVNQTYINQAPPKLAFTDALGAELLAKLPADKAITVKAIGSPSDQAVGVKIANFLRAHGYHVELNVYGGISPPPDHALEWNAARSELSVAPSVR